MTVLDYLVILLLCAGTLVGFFHGLVRSVAHILLLYVVTLVAAFSYPPLAGAFRLLAPRSSLQLRSAVAFLFVLLTLFLMAAYTMRPSFKKREPFLPGSVDRIGGMVAGFFLTGLWIALGFVIVDFLLSVSWIKWEPLRIGIAHLVASSAMVKCINTMLPYIVMTLRPWFEPFGGLPRLFVIQ